MLITSWNRLESERRTRDLRESLKAKVRDPLWLLCRQWQLGEFEGEDAGTPVMATASYSTANLSRFQAGGIRGAMNGAAYDPNAEPLEALVERRESSLSVRSRVQAAQEFLRRVSDGLGPVAASEYRALYIDGAGVDAAVKPDVAPAEGRRNARFERIAVGREIDGQTLYDRFSDDGFVGDSISDSMLRLVSDRAPNEAAKLTEIVRGWMTWFESHHLTASATGVSDSSAWNSRSLTHEFGVSARGVANSEIALQAEHHGGEVDWFKFDVRPDVTLGAGSDAAPAAKSEYSIPTPIVFPGAPDRRWWAFEDRRVSFPAMEVSNLDLAQLLLMEFALVFGNDWFSFALELDVGSVTQLTELRVWDTFTHRPPNAWHSTAYGEAVLPVEQSDASWRMYRHSVSAAASGTDLSGVDFLFLAPALSHSMESRPVEEVRLIRDEIANMAWGIEKRVKSRIGFTEERESVWRGNRDREFTTRGSEESLRYRLMSDVPDFWYPLVPQEDRDSDVAVGVSLQRGRVLRSPARKQELPKGDFLKALGVVSIPEELVPRSGTQLRSTYQFARWSNGGTHFWEGRSRTSGRGEGASHLKFDALQKVVPASDVNANTVKYAPYVLLSEHDGREAPIALDMSYNRVHHNYVGDAVVRKKRAGRLSLRDGVELDGSNGTGAIRLKPGRVYPACGPGHSFVAIARGDWSGDAGRTFFEHSSGLKIALNQNGGLGWNDGELRSSDYVVNSPEKEVVIGWRLPGGSDAGQVIVNGLPIFAGVSNGGAFDAGGDAIWGERFDGSESSSGVFFTLMHAPPMTLEEHYAHWVDVGGTEQWFKEVVVDQLQLAQFGVAGDVVLHAPCWETERGVVADVSMHQHHGSVVGVARLGEKPPKDSMFEHSVGSPSGTGLNFGDVGDFGTGAWAMSIWVKNPGASRGIVGKGARDLNSMALDFGTTGNRLALYLNDGTHAVAATSETDAFDLNDGEWHQVGCRWSWGTQRFDVWHRGKRVAEASLEGLVSAPMGGDLTVGYDTPFRSPFKGSFAGPFVVQGEISDGQMRVLTGGPGVLRMFPLHRYVSRFWPNALLGQHDGGMGNQATDLVRSNHFVLVDGAAHSQVSKTFDLGGGIDLGPVGGLTMKSAGTYPETGPGHSFMVVCRGDWSGGGARTLFEHSGGFRLLMSGSADGLGWVDSTGETSSGYSVDSPDSEVMLGWNLPGNGAPGHLLMNGLPFFSAVSVDEPFDRGGDAVWGRRLDSTEPSGGTLFTMLHAPALNLSSFHDAWVAGGGTPHWYKTKLVDELGIAELGIAGAVKLHCPTWETERGPIVDVSMHGNHGTPIGVPKFAMSPPEESGLMGAIDNSTGTGFSFGDIADFGSGVWTLAVWVKNPGSSRGVWGKGDRTLSGAYFWAGTAGSAASLRIGDGSSTVTATAIGTNLNDGAWHRLVVRMNWTADSAVMPAETVELWVDGVLGDSESLAGITGVIGDDLTLCANIPGRAQSGAELAGPTVIGALVTDVPTF